MTSPDPNNDPVEFNLYNTDLTTGVSILPSANSTLYLELNETGTGNLSVPSLSNAAALLTSSKFIRAKYRGALRGGFFVENINESIANAGEGGELWKTVSGRGALALLDDAIVWDDGTNATTRTLTGTKAAILLTFIVEAQARGALAALVVNFNSTVDTNSVAWTDSETMEFTVGKSLLDVVREIAEMGIDFNVTVNTNGTFTLSAYKNGYGSDLSETVFFRLGTNCAEVGSTQAGGEIKNALLIKYGAGYANASDATSISSYRRREEIIDAIDAQTSATAVSIGSAKLDWMKDPKTEISVSVYDGVNPRVFIDYNLGDTITLDRSGTEATYRVRSLLLSWDEDEKASVVVGLNSTLFENEIRQSKKIKELEEGLRRAHDADLLETSFWAAIGEPDDAITEVTAIHIIGTKAYVGGVFTKIGDVNCTNFAIYDIATGQWSASSATGMGGAGAGFGIHCMESIGTDLYVGGYELGGSCLSKYDTLTDTWTSLLSPPGQPSFYPQVYALRAMGTILYATGKWATGTVGGVVMRSNYLKYDTVGGVHVLMVNHTVGIGHALTSIGTILYLGGETDGAAHYIHQYDTVGDAFSDMGAGLDGEVYTLAVLGTSVIAGGAFTGRISEWGGSSWAIYGGGLNGDVYALAVYLTDIYATGDFTDSTVGNQIAKYSGGMWSALTTGINSTGYALALNTNDAGVDVYVGGLFTTAGDKTVVMIAVYYTNFDALLYYLEDSGSRFDMGAAIHNATASAITDTDEMGFWEATANALRKITWANIKATLKTYFDTLYVALTGDQTVAGVKSFSSAIVAGNHAVSLGGAGDVEMFAATGENPAIIQHAFGGVVGFVGMTTDGTEALKTAVPSGKVLYNVAPYAYDGVGYYADAHLKNVAAEAHDATHHGTKWELWATPLASTTETLIATIAPPTAQYKYLVSSATPFAYAESAGALNIASGKTLTVSNSVTIAGTDGGAVSLAVTSGKTLTLTCADNYNLTVPGTGVALVKPTALTAGYIPFGIAGSLVGEDAGLFWDNPNKRLGIGTVPTTTVEIKHPTTDTALRISTVTGGQARLEFAEVGSTGWSIGQRGADDNFYINNGLGGLTSATKLFINTAGNVVIGGTSSNAAAILELSSTTKGFRLPNMTTTQRNAISSPPPGLMVYDTTTDFIYRVNNAGTWLAL